VRGRVQKASSRQRRADGDDIKDTGRKQKRTTSPAQGQKDDGNREEGSRNWKRERDRRNSPKVTLAIDLSLSRKNEMRSQLVCEGKETKVGTTVRGTGTGTYPF